MSIILIILIASVVVLLLTHPVGWIVLAKAAFAALIILPLVAWILAQQEHGRVKTPPPPPARAVAHLPNGDVIAMPGPVRNLTVTPNPGQVVVQFPSAPANPAVPAFPFSSPPVVTAMAPIETHVDTAPLWLLLLPAVAALAGFALVRRSRRRGMAGEHHGSGMGWLAFGVATFVILGFLGLGFFGVRTVRINSPMAVMEEPPGFRPSMRAPYAASDRALIDQQWERLTGPRIKLDEADATAAAKAAAVRAAEDHAAAQRQLNEAAEVLQAASKKMAEASAEGWLLTAAKSILNEPEANTAASGAAGQRTTAAENVKVTAASDKAKASKDSHSKKRPAAKDAGADHDLALVDKFQERLKPAWVDHQESVLGDGRSIVVSAGPYETVEECHQGLEEQMRQALSRRIERLATTATGDRVSMPPIERLHIGADQIIRDFCHGEYVETVETSVGDMKKAYVLLQFSDAQDEWLLDRWKADARFDRMAIVGLMSGLVLGGVALVYGLLKVDTWTRGYYSKRLFLGVPAAIIGLIVMIDMFS